VAERIMDGNAGPIGRIAEVLLEVDDLSGERLQALLGEVVILVPEDIHLRALVERQAASKRNDW
jgi:hypothetical protein